MYQCRHTSTTEPEISINKSIDTGRCNYINSIHFDNEFTQYAQDAVNIAQCLLLFFLFSTALSWFTLLNSTDLKYRTV